MKKLLQLLFLLISLTVFSQGIKPIDRGFITITTGQKIEFTNLRFQDNQVVFKNVATKSEFNYFLNSVKTIVDGDNSIVFENRALPKAKISQDEIDHDKIKADTLFKPNYPDGIYKTKEDFIKKTPSEVIKLVAKGIHGLEKPTLYEIVHNCYFYDEVNDSKIKNVFAVSFKGHLYFQINGILSNRNKTDRAQSNDAPNGFVRVLMGGNNYFYTEANLVNQWAQGLAYGAIGGVVGVIVAQNIVYGKGVVWDFKNQEFNIFKNCEDFNDFAKIAYSAGVQDCPDQQPDVLKIRNVIRKIK